MGSRHKPDLLFTLALILTVGVIVTSLGGFLKGMDAQALPIVASKVSNSLK